MILIQSKNSNIKNGWTACIGEKNDGFYVFYIKDNIKCLIKYHQYDYFSAIKDYNSR